MVRDDDQVRDVLGEVARRRRATGRCVVDPLDRRAGDARPARGHGRRHGVHVVDAPVSGGAMGAADGTLAIMVGGDRGGVRGVREPVLDAMGSLVVHAGPIGAGTRIKLARNLMHFVAFTAATEAQRLAEAAGLDLVALGEVVRHTDAITGGPGRDHAPRHHGAARPRRLLVRRLRARPWPWARRTSRFAIELADELGVDVPLARLARERLGPGSGCHDGSSDHGQVRRLPEERRARPGEDGARSTASR